MITWIAVDWGTTHLRAYAMNEDNQVIDEANSSNGMGVLTPDAFEPALMELIQSWLPEARIIPVLACGMVGARQGWAEAPYRSAPCESFSIQHSIQVDTHNARIKVHILPGISQPDPADVMRGEETQIAGLIAIESDAFSAVCLPGTHSKWVSLKDGTVDHFTTSMTGEMFSLLSEQSILRHSTSKGGWNDNAFLEGAKSGIEHPENLISNCFRLRARYLLNDFPAEMARSHLSGLLIGAELSGSKRYWQSQRVAIIGDPFLTTLYANALALLDVDSKTYDPKAMTLAGLIKAYQSLSDSQGN
jgi:2-dehydro-3-deoxygalactonokinase